MSVLLKICWTKDEIECTLENELKLNKIMEKNPRNLLYEIILNLNDEGTTREDVESFLKEHNVLPIKENKIIGGMSLVMVKNKMTSINSVYQILEDANQYQIDQKNRFISTIKKGIGEYPKDPAKKSLFSQILKNEEYNMSSKKNRETEKMITT